MIVVFVDGEREGQFDVNLWTS